MAAEMTVVIVCLWLLQAFILSCAHFADVLLKLTGAY